TGDRRNERGGHHAADEFADVHRRSTPGFGGRVVGAVGRVAAGRVAVVVTLAATHLRIGTRIGLLSHASGLVVLSGIHRLSASESPVVPTEGSRSHPPGDTTRAARPSRDDRAARAGTPRKREAIGD